jgi:hypothetical protein
VSRIVQEKFEVRPAENPNDDAQNGWASDASARTRKGLQTRAASDGRFESFQGDELNRLPPGTDIEDQEHADIHPQQDAGDFMTGSQATSDVNRTSMREGFDKKPMSPTDDLYTREHNDAFYDDVGGFVERNNYLDRL